MSKKLVIVESPTKAKTISKFLPRDYQVKASMGHVRDLPASAAEIPEKHKGEAWSRLGVNVEEDFDPLYVIPDKKRKLIDELKERYAIVIVTHSMQQAARVSQRTAFFHLGIMVEYGDTSPIFTNPSEERTKDYITRPYG